MLKCHRPSSEEQSSECFTKPTFNTLIRPIPIVHRKIHYQGDTKPIYQIPVKGYKYLSQVAATGEFTIDILKKIKLTSNIKQIRSLEFDPYFCSTSGLKPLSEVLKKFKRVVFRFNLVIRRLESQEEYERFSPYLTRLSNLIGLKIEVSNMQIFDERRVKEMMRSFTKLFKLKSLELKLNKFQSTTENSNGFRSLFQKVKKLERLSYQIQSQKLFVNKGDGAQLLKDKSHFKALKSFSLKFSFKTGWIPSFQGADLGFTNTHVTFWKILPQVMNPIHLSFSLNKFPLPTIVVNHIAGMLSEMTNLRFVYLEITKTRLREFELMTFAQGFLKCKSIEHLTFKYLENSPLAFPDIIQFIVIMATYCSFPKMDLYFRK